MHAAPNSFPGCSLVQLLRAEEAEQLLPAQLTALRAPDQVSPEVRLMSGTRRAGLGSVDMAAGPGTAPTPPATWEEQGVGASQGTRGHWVQIRGNLSCQDLKKPGDAPSEQLPTTGFCGLQGKPTKAGK